MYHIYISDIFKINSAFIKWFKKDHNTSPVKNCHYLVWLSGYPTHLIYNQAKLVYFYTQTHKMHTYCKEQARGNSSLNCHRQSATCHAAPQPPNRHTHTNRSTHPHIHRWQRTGSVTTPHLSQTQVHSLLLPLANYHLQTPCIVSLLTESDL